MKADYSALVRLTSTCFLLSHVKRGGTERDDIAAYRPVRDCRKRDVSRTQRGGESEVSAPDFQRAEINPVANTDETVRQRQRGEDSGQSRIEVERSNEP